MQTNIAQVGDECNIFLVSAIFSCIIIRNKTVNIIIIIIYIRLFYSVNNTKIKELQFQLFGGHFGIMRGQYFYNIVYIRVLRRDNIAYTDLLLRQIA